MNRYSHVRASRTPTLKPHVNVRTARSGRVLPSNANLYVLRIHLLTGLPVRFLTGRKPEGGGAGVPTPGSHPKSLPKTLSMREAVTPNITRSIAERRHQTAPVKAQFSMHAFNSRETDVQSQEEDEPTRMQYHAGATGHAHS